MSIGRVRSRKTGTRDVGENPGFLVTRIFALILLCSSAAPDHRVRVRIRIPFLHLHGWGHGGCFFGSIHH